MSDRNLEAVQRLLAGLIEELGLRLEAPLLPQTPLSELGLQSLHLMELGFRIAEAFRIDLSRLEDPAVFLTVETLARAVDAAVRDRGA
jgi:acyl carrier protein